MESIFNGLTGKLLENLRLLHEYMLIRASGLFDRDWYLVQNPDVAKAKVSPLLHYLRFGWRERRDPNPNFFGALYLDPYVEDFQHARMNPLVHYLKHGRQKRRNILQTIAIQFNTHAMRHDPIIVHQMGKVGSRTVRLSLRKTYDALGIPVPIYHTHALMGFEEARKIILQEESQQDPASSLAALEYGEGVRKLINENPSQHWNIVSLVRDPIARNISSFFHNLQEFIPNWQMRYADDTLSVDEVRALFLRNSLQFDKMDYWFEGQMKGIPAFGIDVYATPFPHDIGYKIYRGTSQASLLLIRLENLEDCAESAMQEFLGLENFVIQKTNTADEKDFATLYRAFKKLTLPVEYVERVYQTELARHFYSEMELAAFTKKWTKT